MLLRNTLSHHVLFWLKTRTDRELFIEGLKTLIPIKSIRNIHIGVPADTFEDVVDRTYDVSLLVLFDDIDGLNDYHADKLHDDFLATYAGPLVEKVVVHDSINA